MSYSLKKIILSKGRYDAITTHRLFWDYVLLVPDSEKTLYQKALSNELPDDALQCIPDSVVGLAAIRNWILDSYAEDVVMLDDDITTFHTLTRKKAYKITNPDVCEQVVANTYINAKDAGCRVFGLNQCGPDPRKYQPDRPFRLTSWTGTIIGVIGKELRFDEKNKLRVDADFCLQSLMADRILWMDARFAFSCERDTNAGGNAFLRSKDNLEKEKAYLKKKWGNYINFKKAKNREGLSLAVKRKDPDIRLT